MLIIVKTFIGRVSNFNEKLPEGVNVIEIMLIISGYFSFTGIQTSPVALRAIP